VPADPFWHGLSSVTGIWATDIWVRVIKLYAKPVTCQAPPSGVDKPGFSASVRVFWLRSLRKVGTSGSRVRETLRGCYKDSKVYHQSWSAELRCKDQYFRLQRSAKSVKSTVQFRDPDLLFPYT
jgi:hypothetical protein